MRASLTARKIGRTAPVCRTAYVADGNLLYAAAKPNLQDTQWRTEVFESATQSAANTPAYEVYDGLGRLQGYQRGVGSADAAGRYTAVTTPSIASTFYSYNTIETHYREQTFGIDNSTSSSTAGDYKQIANADDNVDSDDPNQPARRQFQASIPASTVNVPVNNPVPVTTDLFTEYDAWGRLTYKGTATSQSATLSGTVSYPAHPFAPTDAQVFSYDALGRRISKDETVSTGQTASSYEHITHLYYDQDGNVLEERTQSSPSATPVVSTQYVWSLLGGNIMTLFDNDLGIYGSEYGKPGGPAGGLSNREWVEQGPDGSTWQVISDDGSNASEDYLYTPSGQVTVLQQQMDHKLFAVYLGGGQTSATPNCMMSFSLWVFLEKRSTKNSWTNVWAIDFGRTSIHDGTPNHRRPSHRAGRHRRRRRRKSFHQARRLSANAIHGASRKRVCRGEMEQKVKLRCKSERSRGTQSIHNDGLTASMIASRTPK